MKIINSKNPAVIFVAAAVLAVMLAVVFPLTGCGEAAISSTAQNFINMVMRIKTPVTVDSGAEIEACYILYEHTTEHDRADADVIEKKILLDGYKSECGVLQAAEEEAELLANQAAAEKKFKSAVESLPLKLTSANRADVDAAYALYEKLSEQSKAAVSAAYAALVEANEKVAVIEQEEWLAEIADTAEKFIEGVNDIGEVTLKSFNDIDDLLYDYSRFPDEVINYEGVAEAKAKLDAVLEEYYELKDEDDIEKFLEYAEELSPVESKVTLESGNIINKAEVLYKDMSERALAAEGVAEAHEVMVSARAKYDELYAVAEAERRQIFIAAANEVRTDIENVAIDWFYTLEAAKSAYNALDYDSISVPEVAEAFKRYNAAQTAFDQKGYKRIPMNNPGNPGIVFSGDTPPHIVLQLEDDMLNPVLSFYEAENLAKLDDYAVVWLNVYVDGEYQCRGQLKFADLGHIIQGSKVLNLLKELSAENEKVVSGASFSFSLTFEDKENRYVPSAESNVSIISNNYIW